jgi:hypothetical protein
MDSDRNRDNESHGDARAYDANVDVWPHALRASEDPRDGRTPF